ncbi:MAG TPA: hypothetical protein VFU14_00310 [Acidimicrobiales bacterium]|nr:hypothetical protein [Acidimicrobiales bacterium]
MHVLVSLAIAAVVHVGIVRSRLPLLVVAGAGVLVLALAGALVRPDHLWQTVSGVVIVFVALVTAVQRRRIREVVDGLANLTWHPGAVPADGEALVRDLEVAGFQLADDGWARAGDLGWCVVALRRGPLRAFVVSGELGPMLDITTALDNGRLFVTTPSAMLRVGADVVRLCVPTDDPHELIARHEGVLVDVATSGRTPMVPDTERLTAEAVADELVQARAFLAGGVPAALVSVWRQLRGAHADTGPITQRPVDWARLVAEPR